MPIRPENRNRYPKNWKEISNYIRFERAEGRCEFIDEATGERCEARHGQKHPVTGSIVVLTTAHINHVPEDCDENNLKAACQRCHNKFDAPMRRAGIKARKEEAARIEREKVLKKDDLIAFEIECATGRKVAR